MEDKVVKMSFVGDIMCEQEQLLEAKRENNVFDFSKSFDGMKNFFENDVKPDFLVGNLETVLGYEDFTNEVYSFNTPTNFAKCLKYCGFNLLTTANNHSLDRGIGGIYSTIDVLDNLGIEHIGTYKNENENKYLIKDFNGIRIGFITYTYGTNRCMYQETEQIIDYYKNEQKINRLNLPKRALRKLNLVNLKKEKEIIQKINQVKSKEVDFVVVIMHWGNSWNSFNIIPDSYTARLQNVLKKAGADLIIGSHAHVIQKMILENYKGKKIFTGFSLGNFLSTPGSVSTPLEKLADYSAVVNIQIVKSGENTSIKSIGISFVRTINRSCIETVSVEDLYLGKFGDYNVDKLKSDIDALYQIVFGRQNNEGIRKEYQLYGIKNEVWST